MFRSNLFTIPYWMESKCNHWEDKKTQITNILEAFPEDKKPGQNFSTNRQYNREGLASGFMNIFNEEIIKFQADIQKEIKVTDIWSVTYEKDDFHIPHNHGSIGFCGIVYLDFEKDSPNTFYIQPWNNFYTDMTDINFLRVSEGTMIIVPKFIKHYTVPNFENKKKRILSFDIITR